MRNFSGWGAEVLDMTARLRTAGAEPGVIEKDKEGL